MRSSMRKLATGGVAALTWLASGCGNTQPASLHASVVIIETDGSCVSGTAPGTSCSVTRTLNVILHEDGGRDVQLESVSAVLWDTRGMQDMHATPSMLSSVDIRRAAGSNVVPGHGQLAIPYALGFTVVQPYILGPLKVMVHVRGRDTADNAIEADGEAS
jgi:hypothetical protein